MISKNLEKIRVRSLSQKTYLDELPLNWYRPYLDAIRRRVDKNSYRIINREHQINSLPEE